MRYRAALIGSMLAGLLVSSIQNASAQKTAGFEQIPGDQSPIAFNSGKAGQGTFLRQYRDNSTVFVGRWFAPRTAKEPATAASDLYLETVYTTSAAGYRFSTAMAPSKLLEMFDSLKDRTSLNGREFTQDTRYGPIQLAPFVRQGSQCVSFVGQWDPQVETQRGSRLLGYYCTPVQQQSASGAVSPTTSIPMIDAQQFAAGFFSQLDIQLPEDGAITATVNAATTSNVIEQPQGDETPALTDGIAITTNWNGVRGTGVLRFDQPAGEGTMIFDDKQRHCEGIWRHEGGAYETPTLPFGTWYVYCNDSSFARGHYTSESATTVTGDGQDNQGQAVYFRQKN